MDTTTVDSRKDEDDVAVDGDDVFDLSTIERMPSGGVRYVDPVLADIAKKRIELQGLEREIKRQLRHLDTRESRRLKALNALGSLTQYPTEKQRRYIALFEQSVGTGNAAMIEMAYGVCLEGECEKTNWKSAIGEPLATCFARVMTEIHEKEARTDE